MIEGSVIVAEDADNSEAHTAMFRDRIPPRILPQLPRPSAEEIDVIKQWIRISAGPKEFTNKVKPER